MGSNYQERLNMNGDNPRERRKIINEFLTNIGMEGYEQTEEELDKEFKR